MQSYSQRFPAKTPALTWPLTMRTGCTRAWNNTTFIVLTCDASYIVVQELEVMGSISRQLSRFSWVNFRFGAQRKYKPTKKFPASYIRVLIVYGISTYMHAYMQALKIEGVTFQEIMRQYRHQPQAKNHVSGCGCGQCRGIVTCF